MGLIINWASWAFVYFFLLLIRLLQLTNGFNVTINPKKIPVLLSVSEWKRLVIVRIVLQNYLES